MAKVCKKILILDHHKTAEENLSGIDLEFGGIIEYVFDMDRSGAQIAWDYCYPTINRPSFIDYIADRDLWNWELKYSKEISKALYFDDWYQFDKLEELYTSPEPKELIIMRFAKQGKLLLKYEQKLINNAIEHAIKCKFEGYTVLLSNCEYTLRSEVGSVLAKQPGIDFSAIWTYSFKDKVWWISLRGSKDCNISLHHIAQKFDGGGHMRSAGFKLKDNIHKYFELIKEL